jgi:hypothetical protein
VNSKLQLLIKGCGLDECRLRCPGRDGQLDGTGAAREAAEWRFAREELDRVSERHLLGGMWTTDDRSSRGSVCAAKSYLDFREVRPVDTFAERLCSDFREALYCPPWTLASPRISIRQNVTKVLGTC